jgi:hypothetical protein
MVWAVYGGCGQFLALVPDIFGVFAVSAQASSEDPPTQTALARIYVIAHKCRPIFIYVYLLPCSYYPVYTTSTYYSSYISGSAWDTITRVGSIFTFSNKRFSLYYANKPNSEVSPVVPR